MKPYYLYSHMPPLESHKSWAEIDLDALAFNYKRLQAFAPNKRHICVVKADAYGHTAALCVKRLLAEGCDFFAVACIEEAISVRKICDETGKNADVMILGYTVPSQAELLSKYDIIQTVLSYEYAQQLSSCAMTHDCRVRVHIALDTGMNRIGVGAYGDDRIDCAGTVKKIVALEGLISEGMFTHFAKADDGRDRYHTSMQFKRFEEVKHTLGKDGVKLFCHVSNSAALVRYPDFALDGVRFGILLYGASPSEFIDARLVGVKPVMRFMTVISHIHSLKKGEILSYGGTYQAKSERVIATLPIGYADGMLRAYSGYSVTVHTSEGDFKAEVVGRVCMDQCMIDITDIPAKCADRVTVFGLDGDGIKTLAKMADTIEYEVLCLISARVPRLEKEISVKVTSD